MEENKSSGVHNRLGFGKQFYPGKQILATQSPDTLKWLLFMVTVLPAIGFALTMIPMLFNDYTGKRKKSSRSPKSGTSSMKGKRRMPTNE